VSDSIAQAVEALYGPIIVGTAPVEMLTEPIDERVKQFDVVVILSAQLGPVPELGFVLDFEEGQALVGIMNDPEARLLPIDDLVVIASTNIAQQVRDARGD